MHFVIICTSLTQLFVNKLWACLAPTNLNVMSSFTSFTLYYGWALINTFQVAFHFYPFIIDTLLIWQYGYHTSVLNQLQAVLTCKIPPPHTTCIPMSDVTFSLVTSIFTVGGLIVESPTWLFNQRSPADHKHAVRRPWGDVEEPLLNQLEE